MEFLTQLVLLGILSYPVAFGMNFALAIKMFKDLANEGYKLNVERAKELTGAVNENNPISRYKYYPIINMAASMASAILYNKEYGQSILALHVTQCLDEMTDEEKKDFNEKPTAFNAFKILVLSDLKKRKQQQIEEVKEEYKDQYNINVDYDFKENSYKIDIIDKKTNERVMNTEIIKKIISSRPYNKKETNNTRKVILARPFNNQVKDKPKTKSRVPKENKKQ